MSISKYPSKLSLPQVNPGVSTVFEYLIKRFPDIQEKVWEQRILDGKVHWHDGSLITVDSIYRTQHRVYYYREVDQETVLPFTEIIVYQDEHLLVVHKPHFMAVTPGGAHVNECLQNRLRDKTGLDGLQAIHRLDRATAGLVLFSVNPETRYHYHQLFNTHQVDKYYHAIANINTVEELVGREWVVKNRIVRSDPSFRMEITEGEPNSYSKIRCISQFANRARFELKPITGRTHQLRLHMQVLGWPLLYDRYYPTLQPKLADDYSKPLQLLAKNLSFIDPITQQSRVFSSPMEMVLPQ